MKRMQETVKKEKALLVLVDGRKERWPQEVRAEEFKNLVRSTGIEVGECVMMKKEKPVPSLYVGKGKAEELAVLIQEIDADVAIFNNNLSFSQQRNLEDILAVKTIDRTQLILDIFARHAQTQEGSLEVELAQLEYLLPRLKGKGIMLSRLGGGIGTRGPGEKKLEVDRRRITDRITRLKKALNEVRLHRDVMRKRRQKEKLGVCSLVGYTNAGKSTLFNVLTQEEEPTSSFMFTTLDTVSRTLLLNNHYKVLVTDTVGFLYDLPPNLIEAFKATLEELNYADVLLHVIDASTPDYPRLMAAVGNILKDLMLDEKPIVSVFNKIDKLDEASLKELKRQYPEAVFVSALRRENLEELRNTIRGILSQGTKQFLVTFPFTAMEVLDYLYQNSEVFKVDYQPQEVRAFVRIKASLLPYLEKKDVQLKEI